MPLISIIIPCYNQAQWLPEALDSVRAQSLAEWECIVVNDASTDNTLSVVQDYAGRDARIRCLNLESNRGLAGARNAGMSMAKAAFVLPLDADDKIGSQYLQQALLQFEKAEDTDLVYARAEYFGALSGEWPLPDYHYGLLFARNPIYCSAVFRKQKWVEAGGYSEDLRAGLEDWDFWLKWLSPASKVVRLEQVGFYYRQREGSMVKTLTAEDDSYKAYRQAILSRHFDKWLLWSEGHFLPLLDQLDYYRQREHRLNHHPLAKPFYWLARRLAGIR